MGSQKAWTNNPSFFPGTDENIQSILKSLTYEENGMANEIYVLAERLHKELEPGCPNQTGIPAFIESIKELNSNISDTLAAAVDKEIEINDKIEKVIEQSRCSDNGDRLQTESTGNQVSEPLKT